MLPNVKTNIDAPDDLEMLFLKALKDEKYKTEILKLLYGNGVQK